jgi:hypothetical protein
LKGESYLVGSTALVGTEHDHVWGGVGEFLGVKSSVLLEELEVSTTALKAVCRYVSCMHMRQVSAIDLL